MSQHDHDHEHTTLSDTVLRVKALESLLVEKGFVDPAALDELIDIYEHRVGPQNGARVVARAWTDPEFKARLMADGAKAIREFDIEGRQGTDMNVVENTDQVHNMVVCTLCSCYPWPVLGLPRCGTRAHPTGPGRCRIPVEFWRSLRSCCRIV